MPPFGDPDESSLEAMTVEGDNVIEISEAKAKRARKPKQERQPTGDWRDAILYSRQGLIEPTVANVIVILSNEWRDLFRWDDFAQTIVTSRVPPWDQR